MLRVFFWSAAEKMNGNGWFTKMVCSEKMRKESSSTGTKLKIRTMETSNFWFLIQFSSFLVELVGKFSSQKPFRKRKKNILTDYLQSLASAKADKMIMCSCFTTPRQCPSFPFLQLSPASPSTKCHDSSHLVPWQHASVAAIVLCSIHSRT